MRATILCYHKVGPHLEEGRKLNIEPARLDSHVRFFRRRGAPIVLARDLATDWKPNSVCFSFDDAYVSTLSHATEVLERNKVRGTFYAVTSQVGGSSVWDGDLARPLAPWETLRAAQKRGHEIGNHTLSHPHLPKLSFEEQLSEIQLGHEQLLEEGLTDHSFCYPFGSLSKESVEAVRRVGYRVGLSLRKGHATLSDDRLVLPRIVVAFSDAVPMLIYRLYLRPLMRRRLR